ncbi:MAG TPA: cell wall-binding repeat-containing protein [Actinomycetota bacterium]|jgi:hypothetical protein|nr:cell wall-binding repeat-containing protein [Actinomycetota bacterium]
MLFHRKRCASGIAALGLLLASLTTGVGAAAEEENARVGKNYMLGKDPRPVRARDVPALAVDPNNPRHIVEVDQEYRYENCSYRVTFDGGKTWRGGNLKGPEDFPQPWCVPLDSGGYPHMNGTVAFGSGQNVYATFSAMRAPRQDSVIVAKSTDGGRTFERGVVAMSANPVSAYTRPELTVVPAAEGGEDIIHIVAWELIVVAEGGCCGGNILSATSTDGGETWSSPTLVNLPGEVPREQSQPVVAPDGTVHVAYHQRANILKHAVSDDQGGSWVSEPIAVQNGLFQPKMAVDPTEGTLYISYQANLQGSNDAYLRRSDDGGATWSEPVRINDDPPTNGVHQGVPQVAVGPGGRVDVTWYDRRHFYPGATSTGHFGTQVILEDIYFAYSTDKGETFSPNIRVTDRTINRAIGLRNEIGLYWGVPAVSLGRDKVLIAWPDSRLGNVDTDTQDIFLAKIDLDAGGVPPVQTVRRRSTDDLARALSRLAYPGGGEEQGNRPVTRVVIVNETDPADALAAAVLARANPGPVLTATSRGLSANARREVRRLHAIGAYLVGDVSDDVIAQIKSETLPESQILRVGGEDPAETAAAVAHAMDTRTQTQKDNNAAAFPKAVIVNPETRAAATAVGLAASVKYPILFVTKDSVPEATSKALEDLDITSTFVVGGTNVISDEVMGLLPEPQRLDGTTTFEVSTSVMKASVELGVPQNILYASNGTVTDAALLAASVARRGGTFFYGGGVAKARRAASELGIGSVMDRLVHIAR